MKHKGTVLVLSHLSGLRGSVCGYVQMPSSSVFEVGGGQPIIS